MSDDSVTAAELDELQKQLRDMHAALRELREMVEVNCMCASACVCGAIRRHIDAALTASQGAPEDTAWMDEHQEPPSQEPPAFGKRTKRYATPDGKAPASPSPGLRESDMGIPMSETVHSPGLREQIAENANCSGLRAAVIEECACIAETQVNIIGAGYGSSIWGALHGTAAAIRALAQEGGK